MSLFQANAARDKQRTMLAYRVRYWPFSELSPAGRELLISNRPVYIPKHRVLDMTDDTGEHLLYAGHDYPISWAWNNIPTKEEWDKKSMNYLIRAEFRWSHLIPGGKTVLLSFELPSSLGFGPQ